MKGLLYRAIGRRSKAGSSTIQASMDPFYEDWVNKNASVSVKAKDVHDSVREERQCPIANDRLLRYWQADLQRGWRYRYVIISGTGSRQAPLVIA